MRPHDDRDNRIFQAAYELANGHDQQFALIWIGLTDKIIKLNLGDDYGESLHISPSGDSEGIKRWYSDPTDYPEVPTNLPILGDLIEPFTYLAKSLQAKITINASIDDTHILISRQAGTIEPDELIDQTSRTLERYNPGSSITYDIETAQLALSLKEDFDTSILSTRPGCSFWSYGSKKSLGPF